MEKKRVVVGMSGGVDSSVAAALLKERGYDVIGVYILGWLGNKEFPCDWQKEESDARVVAEELQIPFYTINLSKEYEKEVIDVFFEGYNNGITPNPDILCNKEIKFNALWKAIRQFEPDYLATGHYARMINGRIYKAVDKNKDQSYFLWGIDNRILSHIMFPLGELTKPEVRALAKKFNLQTASKKDSTGICFVGPLKVREFLKQHVAYNDGKVVLTNGTYVADHHGLPFYTIGQRLAVGSVHWTGDVPPLFVIAKDLDRNLLIVGHDHQTFAQDCTITSINWFGKTLPHEQFIAGDVKIRYRQLDAEATVFPSKQDWKVKFTQPVRAITPGQSAVIYDNEGMLLGGGIIKNVPDAEKVIKHINDKVKV